MSANKSIIQLKSLWLSIILMILLSGGGIIWIIEHSNLVYDPSFEGVNNLLVIFKLPLAILALIIPTIAIIASNHRSVQIAKQIELATAQNIFTNYFKHKDEFERYLKRFDNNKASIFIDASELHKLLFPNSINGDFSVSQVEIEEVKKDVDDFKDLCQQLETVDDFFGLNIFKINEMIESICSYFEIDSNVLNYDFPGTNNRFNYVDATGQEQSIFIHGQPIDLLYKYRQAINIIYYAMSFCARNDDDFHFLNTLWKAEFNSECTVEVVKPIYSNFSNE